MRDHLRTQHYSIRTETAYLDWARRFILFHDKQHQVEMGAVAVAAFLPHLAVDRQVSASMQNQAKSAILHLYNKVLQVQPPWLHELVQAKVPKWLPVALMPSEVRELLMHKYGTTGLSARLWYRTSMRRLEALRLRQSNQQRTRSVLHDARLSLCHITRQTTEIKIALMTPTRDILDLRGGEFPFRYPLKQCYPRFKWAGLLLEEEFNGARPG